MASNLVDFGSKKFNKSQALMKRIDEYKDTDLVENSSFASLFTSKLSNIMIIWCCLSIVSLLIGLFLFPNQNLNQKKPNLVQNDSLVSAIIRRQIKLKKGSLASQFRERNVS